MSLILSLRNATWHEGKPYIEEQYTSKGVPIYY
jgi:hypothetical protein